VTFLVVAVQQAAIISFSMLLHTVTEHAIIAWGEALYKSALSSSIVKLREHSMHYCDYRVQILDSL